MTDHEPITKPTALFDLAEAEYHADQLCPERSLSSTMAKTILQPAGPARLRSALNSPPARKRAWDFGSAAHERILGRGQPTVAIDGNRNTKAVREQIASAEAKGYLVLRPDEMTAVDNMAAAILNHPLAAELLTAGVGKPEVSMFDIDERTGRWTRGRLDFLHSRDLIVDYKTAQSINPGRFERAAYDYGYHIQAAHYIRHAVALDLVDAHADYLLIAQEKTAPYLVHAYRFDQGLLLHGVSQVERAITLWDQCLTLDEWPAFPSTPTELSAPRWANLTEGDDE